LEKNGKGGKNLEELGNDPFGFGLQRRDLEQAKGVNGIKEGKVEKKEPAQGQEKDTVTGLVRCETLEANFC